MGKIGGKQAMSNYRQSKKHKEDMIRENRKARFKNTPRLSDTQQVCQEAKCGKTASYFKDKNGKIIYYDKCLKHRISNFIKIQVRSARHIIADNKEELKHG